jgi:hypothetical protein
MYPRGPGSQSGIATLGYSGDLAGRSKQLGAVLAAFAALTSCNVNPHYIGDVCPGAPSGTNACVTFAVNLDRSGVSQLPVELALPGGPVRPIERLRGETAMGGVWTADIGGELPRNAGAPMLDLDAPFTDDTRAVGLATGAPSFVATVGTTAALGGDDFVMEVVLRAAAGATLFEKRSGGVGWVLNERSDGALVLGVADVAQAAELDIASAPLVEGAWYHCLAWVSRTDGGRVDCNGRAGPPVDVSPLGDLDAQASLAAGGGAASARIALLSIYRVPRGGLGPAAGWQEIGARRFAAVTGAGAIALGSATPKPGMRDSPAYLDMQRSKGAPRQLYLVGPDWPRVACRTDSANEHDCGYLSEPARTRFVPADATAFTASEVQVKAGQAAFADGEDRMEGLVPTTASAPHSLTTTSRFDAAHHVFSFFARAGAASRLAVSAGGFAAAVFDVSAGAVVSAPAGVDATIEAWGQGLFRCAYGFDASPGPATYVIRLVDPNPTSAADALFAGDGVTAAIFVAGLQTDVGLRAPGSLLAADPQAADRLAFAADGGNLPDRASVSFTLRMIAPGAARATDQPILSLNRAGLSEDEVQLFVVGTSGHLEYSGVGGGVSRWVIEPKSTLADGQRHVIAGAWSTTSARVSINGVVDAQPATGATGFRLDQIDVAFSPQSSDHLEGLVAGLQFSTP